MKFVKFLFKAILVILVLLVVALLTLPLWFGPVVKGVANAAVPKVTQTGFNLAHLSLNPYTARFELGGLVLDNPQGYSEKIAAKVGELNFDAETLSLATDVIHIEEITVKDIFVSYVDGGENKVNNFQQIQYNVAGGKEKYDAAQAAKESSEAVKSEEPAKDETPAEKKPAKKVIIDKLTISGIKMQWGILPITVPVDICLTDIGKSSGGATFKEVGQQIWESVMKAAGSLGDAFKNLSNMTGDAAKAATESVGKAAGAAADAAGDAAKAAGDAAGAATKAVGDAAGATTKVVGDAAGAATKAAGDAAKAVGDSAGKALDSIKKLW